MRCIYDSDWFGIRFDELNVPLSLQKQADVGFYSAFYKEFLKQYKSYNDLPIKWKQQKKTIAEYLFNIIETENKKKILSIGCGTGFVEYCLVKNFLFNQIELHAIEPAGYILDFLRKETKNIKNLFIYEGLFPDVLNKKIHFDLAYAVSVDYIFNKNEYVSFLKKVKDFGINDFIIVSHSCYKDSFLSTMKYMLKVLLLQLGIYEKIKKRKFQFWGYLRTFDEQKDAFLKAGFREVTIKNYSNINATFIRGKI